MREIKPEDLAASHWEWLDGLLMSMPTTPLLIDKNVIEYVYKTAFIHGFKHGVESTKGETCAI